MNRMKQNNFWGSARSGGVNVGLVVRLSLTIVALAGSITLAWNLLNVRSAHAASVNTTATVDNPWAIVFDGSGNAWVAEPNCNPNPVCNVPLNGAIEEFGLSGGHPTLLNTYAAPTTGTFNPTFLQLDGVGHVWFSDPTNNAIGEVTISNNTWQEFTTGITAHAQPFGLVLDTKGNLWFAERGAPVGTPPVAGVGKIGFFNTTTHAVVENSVPTATGQPDGMTYDTAHNVIWFAEDNAPIIGSFTVTTNGTVTITEHVSNANANPPNPHMIALDSTGNVWYSEQGSDLIGEYNPTSGTSKHYSAAGSLCPTPGVTPTPCTNTYIDGIAIDSTGKVWLDETQTAQLGSLNPSTGAITLFPLISGGGPGDGLAVDSHNNVWVSMLFARQLGELPSGSLPTPTPSVGSGSPSPTTTVTPTPTGTPPPSLQPGPVSKQWYFAEGRVGGGFTEYLSMDNPTPNACTVKVTYLYTPDRGTPRTRTIAVSIPANTRYEEGVDGDLGTTPGGFGVTDSALVVVDTTTTPNCTGIVAERPMYFHALGTNSGSDVLGATHLATAFYIADVAVGAQPRGGNSSSFITILNPPNSSGSATVTASYYANGITSGALVGIDQVAVPVGTRGTIFPNNHRPALPAHVSVIVTSTQPVAVERPTYFSNIVAGNAGTVSGGADVIGVQALSNDWLFAEGYTGGQFQENFVIANLDTTANAPAAVTIKLEPQGGAVSTLHITVPPLGQTIWNVNTLSLLPGQSLSAEISSAGAQIVVEREMFFRYTHIANGRFLLAAGGTDVLGQLGPAAQSLYSFAEGYVNLGYDEWLTLQNPTATAEIIWVTLDNALGHTFTFSLQVNPDSRATVDIVKAVLLGLYHNGDGFKGLEVSMTVQTTATQGGPFVAERPMYWNVTGTQGGSDIIGYSGQ
jgi:streptogramin lyase